MNKILDNNQIKILKFISKSKFLKNNSYWTGGTALAELYLKHRLSEDLDFFSDDLISSEILVSEINKLKREINISKIKYLEDKNRQRFELLFQGNKIIKLEFVYFPFGKLKDKKVSQDFKIRVDNIKSIGENKIFALYEKPEPKLQNGSTTRLSRRS